MCTMNSGGVNQVGVTAEAYEQHFVVHLKASDLHVCFRITMVTRSASPPPLLMKWGIASACPTMLRGVCVVQLTATTV